jgi:hypothetical protein
VLIETYRDCELLHKSNYLNMNKGFVVISVFALKCYVSVQ